MGEKVFFRPHLGLGDHIICNGMSRRLAREADFVVMPVKYHNVVSVSFMLSDVENLKIIPVHSQVGDHEADAYAAAYRERGFRIQGIGNYAPDFLSGGVSFDQSFHDQLKMDHETQWRDFKTPRSLDLEREFALSIKKHLRLQPADPYIFCHDDPVRNLVITPEMISSSLPILRPNPNWTPNIFLYASLIEGATEVHCMDSSFALFSDHLNLNRVSRLCLHRYLRPELPPTYRQKWKVIEI